MNFRLPIKEKKDVFFNFKIWILLVLLVFLFPIIIFAQNTVYINPDNINDPNQNGTTAHPWALWSSVSIEDNTTYLVHKGTTTTLSSSIAINTNNNITIGTYGSGDDPVIHSEPGSESSMITIIRSSNIIIEGLNLIGNFDDAPTAGVGISDHYITGISEDITVRNCEISYCYNGVRAIRYTDGIHKITIDNCNIHDIREDGVFIKICDSVTVRNSHFWRINMDWHLSGHTQQLAPGDCVQLSGDCDDFLIENNIMDRRFTGLKFCFIHNGQDAAPHNSTTNSGKIIGNTFYPPKDTVGAPSAGGALFLRYGDNVEIAYNKFIGRNRMYSNSTGSIGQMAYDVNTFAYNLIDSVYIADFAYMTQVVNLYNNTFVGSDADGDFMIKSNASDTYYKNNIIAVASGKSAIIDWGTGHYDSTKVITGSQETWASVFGFTDWVNGDYTLLENSPCTDGGIDYADYPYDIDSIPVPQQIRRDIGAHEYQDGGQSNNNPPAIEDQSFDTDENSPNGQQIGTVIATDPDVGQSLIYSIISGNINNAFLIGSASGILSVANTAALDYETNPEFNLTVQVQDNGMGSLTDQAIVTINLINLAESPIANFTANTTTVTAGDSIFFQDESLNLPTNWLWQFEGGAQITHFTENPVVTYNIPGIYDVKLVAFNSNGNDVLIKTDYIEVLTNNNPPIANFTANTTTVTAGDSIFFQDESLNLPTNWLWQFEGGAQITHFTENPVVTYNIPGIYDVKLVAFNSNGNDVLIKTDYIEVLPGKGVFISNNINSCDDYKCLINIYPNPAKEYININLKNLNEEKIHISIINHIGNVVLQKTFRNFEENFNKRFDIRRFSKGVYIVNIFNKSINIREKFLKI